MVCSTLITPSTVEAQEISNSQNKISPNSTTHNENRPAHRIHPYGGTLVWGEAHKPTIINPILTQSSVSATLVELIFDPLIRIDSKGNITPGLAESWDISEDGLEYVFHLKQGVKFHDGVDLTAEDVKFTYELLKDPDTKSPYRFHFELVDRFEVPEKYTFKIILKKSFIPFISKMVRFIAPKHLLINKKLQNTTFNYNPIGTGPFKLKKWDKITNQIILKANTDYFEGRPYLDDIIVKPYSDSNMLWADFMRREVDLMLFLRQEDYSVIENDPVFKAYAVPGSMYYAIVYNVKDPIWQDRELRQGLAHGINTEGIIDALPRFEGMQSTGPFHPESQGYNHEVQPFEYNPVKAKMMFMHRGWQDMKQDARDGENSVRIKNGQELTLKMLVDERNDTYKRMAQIMRQQLAEIGVKLDILLYEDENELTQEYLAHHKPQAWLRLFQGFGPDPYHAVGSWYSLSSEFGKFGNYKNDEIDRLIEMGKSTIDANERIDIYREIHKMIYDDQPACFLFYPAGYFAINADFRNTNEYFSLYMPAYTFKDWYFSKN